MGKRQQFVDVPQGCEFTSKETEGGTPYHVAEVKHVVVDERGNLEAMSRARLCLAEPYKPGRYEFPIMQRQGRGWDTEWPVVLYGVPAQAGK